MIRFFRFTLIMLLAQNYSLPETKADDSLRLAGIFSDRVVLQRDRPAPIWGWAKSGSKVLVKLGEQRATATADDEGAWLVVLKPQAANSKGQTLSVQCDNDALEIHDVLVGDVWHAGGQSNMEMKLAAVAARLPEVRARFAGAEFPAIRFRRVSENQSEQPLHDLPQGQGWIACSAPSIGEASAAAFFFAEKLHEELNVPIGIIDSSRGGTPIEPYIPREAFSSHPTLKRELELGDREDLLAIWKLPGGVRARDANWLPGRLFNSRLAPITRFAVRGAIWYQGESNCGDGEDPRDYEHKMRALITGWRKAFQHDDLPFYFVQLPGSGARAGWPYLREQQRRAADLPKTGLAVTIDLLDGDIHPANKVDVGHRLARWALADEYGKDVPFSGPALNSVRFDGAKGIISFDHAEEGLMVAVKEGLQDAKESFETTLSHFEIADREGYWHEAKAEIQGNTVVVFSKKVGEPAGVRYGYEVNPPHCHLYNRYGLPAAPFCSHASMLEFQPDLPGN